jgi:hypothetical protein
MSIERPFGSNTLPTFVYEPFSYTISNPGAYTLTLSNVSSGIPPGYLTVSSSNVVFSASSNGMGVGSESFTVVASSGGSVVSTSSNIVTVGAGRFLNASGGSYVGSNFAFYKNEPIPPIPLVAPFAITVPTSVPSLPPGLTFTSNASNSFSVTGTPLVTVPQSNYLFIGKATGSNLGKIVTSQFALSSSNERVILDLEGAPIVSSMEIGTAISPRILTARFPPYPSGGTLRYNWPGLPDGLVVTNSADVVQPPTFFTPSDASSTLIISGTPTLTAANAFRDANISSTTVTFTGTRTSPLPQISNSQAITFGFAETVLFDTTVVPTLYTGVALDPSTTSFRAQTYFGTGSAISSIFSPDLRSDLSLNFVGGGRAYLTGTPDSSTGTASYTVRAINSTSPTPVTRDLSVPITVTADTVSFVSPPTPAVDICYNFVLSRPISLDLPGYYPSTIQFQATAASGKPVTFSAPALSGTGLSLSNVSANVVQVAGTADTITPLTTVTVTASAVGTPATASRTFKLAVVNDVITFSEPTALQLSFIQNRAITPIQLTATTLSGRSVTSFTSTTLPSGLSLSTTGLITGTPSISTGGTFTVIASTGFMSQSKVYTYTLTADSVLFIVPQQSYTYAPLGSASIDIDALTYSGVGLSNFAFSGFTPSYGLSIAPSTGVISGTFVSGLPPVTYPTEPVNFSVTAAAGGLTATLPSTFSVVGAVVHRSFLLVGNVSNVDDPLLYTNDDDTYSNWTSRTPGGGSSLTLKNTTLDSNVYVLATGGPTYYRSTNGVDWTNYVLPTSTDGIYTTVYDASANIWYAAGTTRVEYGGEESYVYPIAFFTSSNDGQSWTRGATVETPARQTAVYSNYFTESGVAFGVKDGVFLVGGGSQASEYYFDTTTIQRSTDSGQSWSVVEGAFEVEVGAFELAGSTWVAAGSSGYSAGDDQEIADAAVTLKWSEDQGQTWSNATGAGAFDVTATQVVYAGGKWLAAGVKLVTFGTPPLDYSSGLSASSDGKDWSVVTLPDVNFPSFTSDESRPRLPEIGSIWFDATDWYVLTQVSIASAIQCKVYKHSLTGDLTTGWTVYRSETNTLSTLGNKLLHGFKTNFVRTATPMVLTLSFNSLPPNGPTVTSPSQRDYTFYQYATITSIVVSATGVGQVYYFVDDTTLPVGLSFDPITATVSGRSVRIGTKSFVIYVKDSVGVTAVAITTRTLVPDIQKQQTSAGSWTSLVRQYTIVNAAQNSLNGKTLPATEPLLGEFMSPEPPDVVNVLPCPKC